MHCISKKNDKIEFIKQNKPINWENMTQNKDGIYTATDVKKYITSLKMNMTYDEGTYEYIVMNAYKFLLTNAERCGYR